ncbi:hypothetical protein Sjap_001674 [Stephania japonica]|uniref:Uncharacterized protein n=1 Tax=Stephania japonica TaxID=461633 RepID=A0AAP0PTR2_9MAGN
MERERERAVSGVVKRLRWKRRRGRRFSTKEKMNSVDLSSGGLLKVFRRFFDDFLAVFNHLSLQLDNNDGSYSIHYLAKDFGGYDACVSFEGKNLSSCPFGISVYASKFQDFIPLLVTYFQNLESILKMIHGLHSINEDFSGEDIIQVYMRNKYDIYMDQIPVFVQPINDPPFIHVPEFIILEGNKDGSQIFGVQTQFSIGDPDLLSFPGMLSLKTDFPSTS